MDDAVALIVAPFSPEVELGTATASWGNIALEGTYPNARRVLALVADVLRAAGEPVTIARRADVRPEWQEVRELAQPALRLLPRMFPVTW